MHAMLSYVQRTYCGHHVSIQWNIEYHEGWILYAKLTHTKKISNLIFWSGGIGCGGHRCTMHVSSTLYASSKSTQIPCDICTTFKMHSYAVFYYAHPYTLHFNRAVCTILSHILLCRHARTLYIFLLLANINNVWKCVKKYARAACIGWCQPLPLSFSCIVRKRCCKPHCYTNLFSVFFFFFLLLTRWHFELRWKVVWPESKERLCIYTNSLCLAHCPAS